MQPTMYTLCSHCKTVFRINASQLTAAQGRVRCGICRASFSALDGLSEHLDALISKREMPAKPALVLGMTAGLTEAVPAIAPGVAPPPQSTGPIQEFAPSMHTEVQVSQWHDVPATHAAREQPPASDAFDLIHAPPIVADEQLDPITPQHTERVWPAAPERLSGGTGVPLRAGLGAALAWSVVNFLLITVLVMQYAYFNRNNLAHYAELRPWLEEMCHYAGCALPPQRDVTQITLVNRELRSHPTAANALLVTATLVNNAPFSQPYPMLQLSLSDFSGKTVAMRRFNPEEYMGKDVKIPRGMTPKQPIEVSLELVDPGKAAVGFEFTFL